MKKKTAIWIKIIVLGILTLALIGILIVGILGNTFRNFPIFGSFSSYDNADLYQVGNADISASELSSLSIDWVSGSVKLMFMTEMLFRFEKMVQATYPIVTKHIIITTMEL